MHTDRVVVQLDVLEDALCSFLPRFVILPLHRLSSASLKTLPPLCCSVACRASTRTERHYGSPRGLGKPLRRVGCPGRHGTRDSRCSGGAPTNLKSRAKSSWKTARGYVSISLAERRWAIGSGVEHILHTDGVTSSNLVSPTIKSAGQRY